MPSNCCTPFVIKPALVSAHGQVCLQESALDEFWILVYMKKQKKQKQKQKKKNGKSFLGTSP